MIIADTLKTAFCVGGLINLYLWHHRGNSFPPWANLSALSFRLHKKGRASAARAEHLIRRFVTPSPQGEGMGGRKSGDTFVSQRRLVGDEKRTRVSTSSFNLSFNYLRISGTSSIPIFISSTTVLIPLMLRLIRPEYTVNSLPSASSKIT